MATFQAAKEACNHTKIFMPENHDREAIRRHFAKLCGNGVRRRREFAIRHAARIGLESNRLGRYGRLRFNRFDESVRHHAFPQQTRPLIEPL